MLLLNNLRRGLPVGAILIGALVLLFVATQDGNAAQRKVMFEEFTSTTCPPCAGLAPILEQVFPQVADICSETVYHMNWPGAGTDPWNRDNRADNGGSGIQGGRCGYYGVNGVPTMYIDGAVYGGTRSVAAITAAIRNESNQASPASMVLTGRVLDGTLTVHVEVTAESALNTRLYICLNEEQYHFQAEVDPSWDEHYHPMVKMIPDYQGTAFQLAAGQTREFDFEQSMDGLGWHELDATNLELVAFLQDANHTILQSEKYELGITSPSLSTVSWSVTDAANGDGDGRAEPGETADIWFTLENSPRFLPAESVRVEVATDDPEIQMVNAFFTLDGLENGAQANNENSPIRFSVPEGFVAHPVIFTVTTTAQPGDFSAQEEIEFMVNWPPFLVVDASNNGRAGSAIVDLFGRVPLPWCDRWDRTELGVVPEELLPNYNAIIWHAFNNQDAINEFEAEILVAYLEQGGKLVISGSYIPTALADNALLSQYLGVSVDNANIGQGFVYGVAGDPQFGGCRVFPGGGNGAGTAERITSFTAHEGTRAVLYYDDGAGHKIGDAGMAHETAVYSTLVIGFPIESIGAGAGTEQRQVFMNRVWNWVQNGANSVSEDPTAPVQFALNAAYPNPFNSATVLNFSLPVSGEATLAVYDLSGRNVATLVSGVVAAGRQSINFNATEFGLGAGVYYAKLEAAGQSQSTKLLYLK